MLQFADVFMAKWKAYVAYVGQQVMRARHFALVGTSRKELMYIDRCVHSECAHSFCFDLYTLCHDPVT